jgi:hypothetical protein
MNPYFGFLTINVDFRIAECSDQLFKYSSLIADIEVHAFLLHRPVHVVSHRGDESLQLHAGADKPTGIRMFTRPGLASLRIDLLWGLRGHTSILKSWSFTVILAVEPFLHSPGIHGCFFHRYFPSASICNIFLIIAHDTPHQS